MPPITKSPPSKKKRWARAWCTIGHQMLFFKSNAYTTNKFFSCRCRCQWWISSWDAHGSLNISPWSTGTLEKYSSGVSTVSKSVWKIFLRCLLIPSKQLSVPPQLWKSRFTDYYKDPSRIQDVFSKSAATRLPPHQPWDCTIDQLPGANLQKGWIYPLSIPEHTGLEEYNKEALQQGFIHPSTSPAASSSLWPRKMGSYVHV